MIYPFAAIVDQEEMKLALILNVIDPSIGGVLIMGEKGTGKSTAVRALAELLPEIEVVQGCPFNCDPKGPLCTFCEERKERESPLPTEKRKMEVVELPLGVTEDRVIGTLDLEYALVHGKRRFEPGLLARANRNFLYIDEVNLLEDHIVDLLLDSAAMGTNRVEREGISITHPCRFILVGSMNPEEGELRPQFLDRFGLCVEVRAIVDKKLRYEVLRRRIEFDTDREGFLAKWRPEQEKLREKILKAKEHLSEVELGEEAYEAVVNLNTQLSLDGHRGDIVLLKAARALSAFKGRDRVTKEEIKEIAPLALKHRLKRQPFEDPREELKKLYEVISLI